MNDTLQFYVKGGFKYCRYGRYENIIDRREREQDHNVFDV